MKPSEEQFDDFKVAELPIAEYEAINKVFQKELSEVEKFKEDFDDQLLFSDNPKDLLTEMIVGYVQGVGDVNQVNISSYRAIIGVALDAW